MEPSIEINYSRIFPFVTALDHVIKANQGNVVLIKSIESLQIFG